MELSEGVTLPQKAPSGQTKFKCFVSDRCMETIERFEKAYKEAAPYRYSDIDKFKSIIVPELMREQKRRRAQTYALAGKPEISNPKKTKVLKFLSKRENIIHMLSDWSWTYDPRLVNIGLPTFIPFIPLKKQIKMIEFIYDLYLKRDRGLIEKSREVGATWIVCAVYLHEWRWSKGFSGGIGSNKFENVDKKDKTDSVFVKIRQLLYGMPSWWMPPGFDAKKDDKVGLLVNRYMGSTITGEGGDDIGRSGRKSIYVVDEAAHTEHPEDIDKALSDTTECQIDLSSVVGMNHFGRKRHSGRVKVFTFHWKDDPRKGEAWYEKKKQEHTKETVAQEVDIDYQSSNPGAIIKKEWCMAAIELNLEPTFPPSAGFDVAAGGENKSALYFAMGPVARGGTLDIENGITLSKIVVEQCEKAAVSHLNYDVDGVGHVVKSTLETIDDLDFPCYGINSGGKVSEFFYEELNKDAKQAFANLNAEMFYRLMRRFEKTYEHVMGIRKYPEEELIDIPNDMELVTQLCSVTREASDNGKFKIKSKRKMIADGYASPDQADALKFAYAPRDAGKKHVVEKHDVIFKEQSVDITKERDYIKNYGAISISKNLSVSCLFAIWHSLKKRFYVYDEVFMDYPEPEAIGNQIASKMQLNIIEADKIIGNQSVFEDEKKSFKKGVNNYLFTLSELKRIHPATMKKARKYDPIGSISELKKMAAKKEIIISPDCVKLKHELDKWVAENGEFVREGMQEALLLIISELTEMLKEEDPPKKYTDYALPERILPNVGGDPMAV